MANFKVDPRPGTCEICGRADKDHCDIAYPRHPDRRNALNVLRLRICKDCGALIYKTVVTKEPWLRNRLTEKKIEVITKERTEARREKMRKKKERLAKVHAPQTGEVPVAKERTKPLQPKRVRKPPRK